MTPSVLPSMRAQGSGAVLGVSSVTDHRAMDLTGAACGAATAGVTSSTGSLDLAQRRHGIRACAACPDEVATPTLDRRPQPPSAAARASMLLSEDLANTLLLLATLPQRATVELLRIFPTQQREGSDEVG